MTESAQNMQQEEQHEVTLEEAVSLAQGHHQSGNFILAERTYRDILRSVPDHFPTTHLLGVLLFQSGNYDDAKIYMGKALETEPENPNCLGNYGGVLAQTGDFEGALEYYDRALKVDPQNLEAMNNKTFALWSLERFKEAEALCRNVIELQPENALAYNTLGMILAKRVKYQEAIEAWEEAAKMMPEEVTIWCNWGNACREMGRMKEALEKCQKAYDLNPEHPETLSNLANVYRDMGRTEEALKMYTQATDIKPEYYQAHSNKAVAFMDAGRYEEAVISARYAIAFEPKFVEAYGPLCEGLGETGDLPQAHMHAQRAIHIDPERADSYLAMADVLSRLDQYDDAEASINEALKREPDSARAYLSLATIRDRLNNLEGAIKALDRGLELSTDLIALHIKKGMIYFFDNQVDEGLKHINHALDLAPHNGQALHNKAELLVATNRNDEALEIVRKMIELKTNLPGAYSTLSSLKKFKSEEDEDFIAMKELGKTIGKYGTHTGIVFHYALSDVYEQIGNYEEAFKYLEMASEARAKSLPRAIEERVCNPKLVKARYTKDALEQLDGLGYKSDVPVFIIGMPRSGTTLTEQIISSHPDVFGAGELREITDMLSNNPILTKENVAEIGEEYVKRVKEKDLTGKALRITDKMPANFVQMGYILSILPNAKIIHCRRNPIDTCLSCYKQNFARGQYFSYRQEDLATEYENYLEIMEHWREVLPGRFLEINYEDTVGDFEAQARKLIDFIDLEWDDACLAPHKQKRAIMTASKGQVTKPVYKTSVEKWRRYEEQLQPLVERLMPDQALKNKK